MPMPLLMCQGKVNANNALVVSATGTGTTATPSGMSIAMVQCKVTAGNALVVIVV